MNKFRLLCAAAAIVAPASAYAQETTSSIRGTVSAGGQAVSGARITVTHVPSGTVATATSDAQGNFNVQGLRLGGPFTVDVGASGYQDYSVTDVNLLAGDPFRIPVELTAESGGAEIVVTAQSISGAGTESMAPATSLNRDDIQGVATVNRTVRDLIAQSPYSQVDSTNTQPAISIAGQNVRFNRFSVDGVQFSDDFGINAGGLPTLRGPVPLDAICEFTVEVAPVDIGEGDFQGGAVNAQLCQGNNRLHGGAFFTYNNDNLTGDQIRGNPVVLDTESKVYGAFLRGPIIPNVLFFAVSWERARNSQPTLFGPTGEGFGNSVPISRAAITNVQNLTETLYDYDPGDFAPTISEQDEKVTARVDWNIAEGHRASFTFIYNDSSAFNEAQGSTQANANNLPRLNLFSNSYDLTERVYSGVLQVNSTWSDLFSTEARISYRNYQRGQTPPLGTEFGQFTVCLAPTSTPLNDPTVGNVTNCTPGAGVIVLGPDPSRQANALETKNLDAQFSANFHLGSHNIKFLAGYSNNDVFNLFVQNASGTFYFDSLADYQAGNANSLVLQQPVSGNLDDATAIFNYSQLTFGLMDTWDITDTLTLAYGVRYEYFDQGVQPLLNTFFAGRYGFTNQETLNARDIFLPRIGLRWRPTDRLTTSATFGRYSGGSPDVYVSNSFSTTGVASVSTTITRNTSLAGCSIAPSATVTPAQAQALCAGALNGVFGAGPAIPQSVRNFVGSNVGSLSLANVNAIDPDLEIPNIWRVAGTVSYNADLGPLGDNWFFALDGVYSWTGAALDIVDLRSVQIGTTPDGRPRFGPFPGTSGTNTDLLLTNSSEGNALVVVARFQKEFRNGFSLGAAYTFQDINERSPLTSSTAGSLYNSQATANPNGSTFGTANEEIEHSVKFNLGFRHEFFANAETRINIFGDWRQGRHFSYTVDTRPGAGQRDTVFGAQSTGNRHLLYVPTGTTDALVSYDSAATQAALDAYISGNALDGFRGQIAPKNLGRSPDYFKIDLHVSQDIPTFGFGRLRLFADMENVLNFINNDWGTLRQVAFPFFGTLVDVQCLSTPTPTGTAPAAGTINTASNQVCQQYRYSNFRQPTLVTFTNPSLWAVRVGVRFEF